jgi:hypothetical protein
LLLRVLLWTATVALLAFAVAAGLLAWRVRSGPVPLDFLIPRIKAELALEEGVSVDVEGLELVWQAEKRHAELRARGLRIARPSEGASVTLAAARIRLKRRALLRGQVVVTAIELDAPALQLVRDPAGRFAMQLDAPAGEARDLGWLWAMMQRLEHVAVRDGRIALIDEATSTTWTVPHVDGDVWRAGGPLRVQVGFTLTAADTAIPMWVDALYRFGEGTLALQVSSSGADTQAAFAAWPPTLAPEAHAWVTEHLEHGRIGASVLAVRGHVERHDGMKLALDSLDASVPFEGLTVRWLDTMPPVAGVGGTARFTRDGADIAVDKGTLDELGVGPARVRIGWPETAQDHIAIDARCRGPLASLVGLLDREPITLGQRVSFQTRGLAGTASTRIRLAFPLVGRPRFGKLGLQATATVADAAVPYLEGEWNVAGARATVVVNERAVAIDGTGTVRGVPAAFRFRERFARPGVRRLDVTARLDDPARKALGVDPGAGIAGPIEARVRLAPRREGPMAASVSADLTPAAVRLPVLGVDKAAGDPARIVARLALARGLVSAVERFDVTAGAVTIRGTASRPPAGGAWSLDAGVAFALPDLPDDGGAMHVELTAEDGGWRTRVESDDLGLVLRGYGYERVRGGRTRLAGRTVLGGDGAAFDGEITVEDATFVQVPWLVKVVSLASVRGLVGGLGSEQAVAIDRVVATLAYKPSGLIEIRDAVARGPQLGIKLQGTVDPAQDVVDLTGTVIPSYYFLNEGADSIPVIGGFIGMATGGALQAVTFTVRGSRSDPVVAVQPLSSLAPGVMREWLRKLGL